MSAKISTETILRFLDQERESMGSILVDQEGDWIARQRDIEIYQHQSRWAAFARIVRERAALWADGETAVKALALADAIEATEIPKLEYQCSKTAVTSLWHRTVRGERKAANGSVRPVTLGMVDYVLTVGTHRLELEDSAFAVQIGADASTPTTFEDQVDRSQQADFLRWVMRTSVEDCQSSVGKQWVGFTAGSVEVYVFAVPHIRDVSTLVKKLRRFTETLPPNTVYVCTADQEEAETLMRQGIGTLLFPSGEMLLESRLRESRKSLKDAQVDLKFMAPWAQVDSGAPRPGAA